MRSNSSTLQRPAASRCPNSVRTGALHRAAAALLVFRQQKQHQLPSSLRSIRQQRSWSASSWAPAAALASASARSTGPSAPKSQPATSPAAEPALGPDAPMDAVVRAAVARMGRAFGPKEQELVDLLADNYFDTVASVAELREEETARLAKEWGVPLRLLREARAVCCAAAAPAAVAAAAPAPAAAPAAAGVASAESPEAKAPPPPLPLPLQLVASQQVATPPPPPPPTAGAVAAAAAAGAGAAVGAEAAVGRAGPPAVVAVPRGGVGSVRASGRGQADEEEEEDSWAGVEGLGGEEEEEAEEWSEGEAADDEEKQGQGSGPGASSDSSSTSSSSSSQRGRGAALPEPAPEVVGVPIMERRCPDKFRFGHGSGRSVRLTERKRQSPYSLKPADTPPALAAELRSFELFCLHGSWEAAAAAAGEPLRATTVANHLQCLRQALGWLHAVEGVPLAELSLGGLMPGGPRRSAARRVHAFLIWLETERGVCKRSAARSLGALIAAAKFLFHEHSRVSEGDKPYSDVEVIKTLRSMYMTYERHTRVSGHVVDTAAKWLDWPQYLGLVGELRREAAGLKLSGQPRAPAEVAMSLQAFLIAAILACVPDRQRTLRELQVGRTLVKDAGGTWFIRHGHADYKTGGTYGERPPLVIDPGIYYELEEFIGTWRAHLRPQHDFLFTKRDGSGPLTGAELARAFSLNAFRLTGRKVNPHMVRDMVVTYARSGHATEHELEALAVYMGHSLAEQRGTYDRRTKAQKVAPALGLLAKISGGGGSGSGGGSGGSGSGGGRGAGSGAAGAAAKMGAATAAAAVKRAAVPLAAITAAAPLAAAAAAAAEAAGPAGAVVKPVVRRARRKKSTAADEPAAGPAAAAVEGGAESASGIGGKPAGSDGGGGGGGAACGASATASASEAAGAAGASEAAGGRSRAAGAAGAGAGAAAAAAAEAPHGVAAAGSKPRARRAGAKAAGGAGAGEGRVVAAA